MKSIKARQLKNLNQQEQSLAAIYKL